MGTATRAERWHKAAPGKCHDSLIATAKWIEQNDASRRNRAQNCAGRFEGRKIPGLSALAYSKAVPYAGDGYDELRWKIARSIVLAAQAEIAGTQKPKPQFVTSGSDWATKRRAKRLDRFVEAQMMARQDRFPDFWALGLQFFLDACVWPAGVLKIYADVEEKKVTAERRYCWQILIDPLEAECGTPLNYIDVYGYDEDKLVERFHAKKADIIAADPYDDSELGAADRSITQKKVYEAWRLPVGTQKGRHVICCNGVDLVDEEWTRNEPPLLFLRWTPELMGFWGTALVEEVQELDDEVNVMVERMAAAVALTGMGICFAKEGAVSDEQLLSNEDVLVVKYTGDKPDYVSPQPFGPAQIQWLQMNYEKAFELSGVSQMTASAQKEPGLDAAVAIRAVANIQTKRFSVVFRNYETALAVEATRHIVACTRELFEAHPDLAAKWPGQGYLRELKWGDCDLAEDQYVIQVHPVGGIKNTPADRLQLAQELNASGKLSDDALIRVIQYLDVQSEFEHLNKQRELVGRYIEEWLDATPETVEDGTFKYRAPIPFLQHEDAILQVAQAFLEAQLDEAPDFNTEFFLRFMTQCDQEIQKKAKKAAEIQAIAMGKPPGPPGMPANANGAAPAPAPPMVS